MRLSENIRSLRIQKDLTQKQLAVALSVSPQAVSRWEKGQAYPDVLMLEKLASFFGVTMDNLVGRGAEYAENLLREYYKLLKSKETPTKILEECEILEKLALAGQEQVNYFCTLMRLKNRPDVKSLCYPPDLDKRIESARTLAKEHLKNCCAEQRMAKLFIVFCNEEEERLSQWKDLVPDDSHILNYSDLMVRRYRHTHDKENFEKALQYNTYTRVMTLLFGLAEGGYISKDARNYRGRVLPGVQPLPYCETLLGALPVSSREEADVFLGIRTLIFIQYSAALLKENRADEGFALLEKVKALMILAKDRYLAKEKVTGSIDLLSQVEEQNGIFLFGRVMDIAGEVLHFPEFEPYKTDPRYRSLTELYEKISRDVFALSLKESGMSEFCRLLERARTGLADPENQNAVWALILSCADGRVLSFFYDPAKEEENEKLNAFLEKERPHVKYVVACRKDDHLMPDMPSFAARQKLMEIHNENGSALFLTIGYYKYDFRTIESTMPQKRYL